MLPPVSVEMKGKVPRIVDARLRQIGHLIRPILQMADEGVCDESLPDDEEGEEGRTGQSTGASIFFAKLGTVMRIRNKYKALKRRRMEQSAVAGRLLMRSTAPDIFNFDPAHEPYTHSARQKKKKKNQKVLYPEKKWSWSWPEVEISLTQLSVFLVCAVICLQVYNAIENLDDHLVRYDLDGLEKTLRREVFGQRDASELLLRHLGDYLLTYAHSRPLALSLHGPSGVGKSLVGRVLARHFRSVVGEPLVVQYFAVHHCPLAANASDCARDLLARVAAAVSRAEQEEKIPLLVFDEVESMPDRLLDALHGLLRPEQANEYLNAVYLLIGSLEEAQITNHVLQSSNCSSSSSSSSSSSGSSLALDLALRLRRALQQRHPLWADVDLVPLTLLEKRHVMECFREEMTQEGFYPDRAHVERLAEELDYHSDRGGLQYARTGCKQVVAKVNLL